MIITRWQAPIYPTQEQVKMILESEGLEPFEEITDPHLKIVEHKHPFCEIRIIVEGEMLFNISGNRFVLRKGDRLEIPANTKHTHAAQGNNPCTSICSHRAI